mmetsp:Transcript_5455/g.9951  ORF Transcript_5455/g.9951 Transcript_5455/m.9951 type:complete len:91 (-) Transcript_5455:523-795(-)
MDNIKALIFQIGEDRARFLCPIKNASSSSPHPLMKGLGVSLYMRENIDTSNIKLQTIHANSEVMNTKIAGVTEKKQKWNEYPHKTWKRTL